MNQLLKQLQALIPLAEAVTAGPWKNTWDEVGDDDDFTPHDEVIIKSTGLPSEAFPIEKCVVGMIWYDGPHAACNRENAAFIAAARNVLTQENLQALCTALDKPVADAMGAAEAKYFAHLSDLSPALLLAEWNATEEASHCEPESYKPEYVRLLLQALSAALAPQWVAFVQAQPFHGSDILLCRKQDKDVVLGHYLAFDQWNRPNMCVVGGGFNTMDKFSHWMPLPTPLALTEEA